VFHIVGLDHVALTVRDPKRSEDHTIAHSIYIFDPDGHRVELTTYELT
jgi:catechol 2,3-dioxygenase-like lactoylglutathione lyase family enzyme